MRPLLLLLVVLVLLLPLAHAAKVTSVLFIGNSLINRNNLPAHLKNLVTSITKRTSSLRVYSSVAGSTTLCNHAAAQSRTMAMIKARKYSVVVLQDQSSYLARGDFFARQRVWPCAMQLATAARKSGARVVLYETMAYQNGFGQALPTYETMQTEVARQYEELRAYLGSETAHVGSAFALANQAGQELSSLYSDTNHPSQRGTFLAACSMYSAIYGKSPLAQLGQKKQLTAWLRRRVPTAFAKQAMGWAWAAQQTNK